MSRRRVRQEVRTPAGDRLVADATEYFFAALLFLYLVGMVAEIGSRSLVVPGGWAIPVPDVPGWLYQRAAVVCLLMAGLAVGAVLWRPLRKPAALARSFISPWLLPVRLGGFLMGWMEGVRQISSANPLFPFAFYGGLAGFAFYAWYLIRTTLPRRLFSR